MYKDPVSLNTSFYSHDQDESAFRLQNNTKEALNLCFVKLRNIGSIPRRSLNSADTRVVVIFSSSDKIANNT